LNSGPDRASSWRIGFTPLGRARLRAPSISDRDVRPELTSMYFPHPLSAQLGGLTNASDDPGIDLQVVIAEVAADVTAAVPSFLGLTLTLLLDDRPVTVTAIDADLAAAAGASLQLPLGPLAGAAPGSSVVFYAGRPGAFVDLATDTRYAYGLESDVVLDGHLTPPTRTVRAHPGVYGFDEMRLINQAIGVLIGHGHLPGEAHDELRRRAADHGRGLPEVAEDLLTSNARR
jgi:hypothetical protein